VVSGWWLVVSGCIFIGSDFFKGCEMKILKKNTKIGMLFLAAVFVLAQGIRVDRTNPPVTAEISTDPSIKSLIRQSCYNCHSNETKWPWYSNLAPASWLIAGDVNDGRRKLNFSVWGSYSHDTQELKLREMVEEIRGGDMPPWYYSMMHPGSQVKPENFGLIEKWTTGHY
jgi:hypothetical protein